MAASTSTGSTSAGSGGTTDTTAAPGDTSSGAPIIFDVNGVAEDSGTSTGGPPPFDCDAIPELPLPFVEVRDVPGAEDLAFDALGNVVLAIRGANSLWLYPREGPGVLVHPNIGLVSTAGTAVLPDGDLVVSDEFSPLIARVHPDDGQITMIPYGAGAGCNGLTVGEDGMMYGASYSAGVLRIDPDTHEYEQLFNLDGSFSGIDGITFSDQFDFLYFNEGEIFQAGDGRLFRGHFDGGPLETVDDLGPPLHGTQGTVDGMTADICGNVYVVTSNVNSPTCAGSSVLRVNPDDEAELVTCLGTGAFTPGIEFGSGVGGWERDYLYVIDWHGSIYEIAVEVPGRAEPHYP